MVITVTTKMLMKKKKNFNFNNGDEIVDPHQDDEEGRQVFCQGASLCRPPPTKWTPINGLESFFMLGSLFLPKFRALCFANNTESLFKGDL